MFVSCQWHQETEIWQNMCIYWLYPDSAVVENLTHKPKIKGTNLTNGYGRDNVKTYPEAVFLVVCDPSMNEP